MLTIVRYFVASGKHSQEAQIPDTLKCSCLRSADGVALQRCSGEGGLTGVGDSVGGVETTKPITNPVSVSGPDESCETSVDNGR